MLWLALHLPLLSLEAFCATLPAQAQPVAVALIHQHRIAAVNAAAAACGVRPGMKRATALALVADLRLADTDTARDAAQVAGWSDADTELLLGHLHGGGKSILVEPQALHTEVLRLPGVDGTKMSKSYGNAILMLDDPETVTKKVRGMMTDPARVRRTDPGDPEKCPVWSFHKVYSDEATREWVVKGCTSAGIGCLDCKQPVIDAIVQEQQPWRERAESLLADPKKVHWIVEMGTERARTVARQTMKDVRGAMGLDY